MIIDQELKTFNDSLEGETFSIEDNPFIFDILRNKMYSDPISSIVREVACNARDSHRVIESTKPIEISLPTSTNPFLKIKDYGTGLPKDIISNVFIKYAASTKRGDSIQTGGFGLGAKTPFAYSDSFSIVTIVNKIKYNYVCFIDETKRGKISLLSEGETTEENGTEIAIKIDPKDFSKFAVAVNNLNEFWSEPIIIKHSADHFTFRKKSYHFSFDNFRLGYGEENIYAIIDGIKYPVNNPNISRNYLLRSLKHSLFLFFDNSQLSLSATREQLSYDQKTIDLINKRVSEAIDHVVSLIKTSVNEKDNYKEALSYFRTFSTSIFNSIDAIESLNICYGDKKLFINSSIYLNGCPILTFNIKSSYRSDRIESKVSYSLMTAGDVGLYYNDFEDIGSEDLNSKHFKPYFLLNENHNKKIYVIVPNISFSLDVIKRQIDFDSFDIKPLSSIITKPKKRVIREQKEESTRLTLYKYTSGSFSRVAQKESKEVTNKILIKINKSKNLFYFNEDVHSNFKLDNLVRLGYSIYGLVEEIYNEYAEDMTSFKSIEDVIDEILDEVSDKYVEYNVFENTFSKTNLEKLMLSNNYKEIKESLIYEDKHISTVEQIFSLLSKVDISSEQKSKLNVISAFCEKLFSNEIETKEQELSNKINSFDIDVINKDLMSRFPLIGFISRYRINTKDISDYMNGIYLLNQQRSED